MSEANFIYLFITTVVFLAGFVGVVVKWLIDPLNKLDKTITLLNYNIEALGSHNESQDRKIEDLKKLTTDHGTRITVLETKKL
ncbi:MAG: hypothetical protein ACRC37_07075 [Lentisphaeria bacterium]